LPSSKSLVCSVANAHDNGASSIVYSPRHQVVISGGKKGDIVIFDIRQQKVLDTMKQAHTLNVKSLALAPMEDFFVSGSNEGNVKVWDLPSLQPRECWGSAHMKHTFVRKPGLFEATVSTYGVMQVLLTAEHVYSCGSDGRILRTRYFN